LVDGSSGNSFDAAEAERNAYNAAFYELGLRWYWDMEMYHQLKKMAAGRERIAYYLTRHQPHLLRAYDTDFLIDAIESKKLQCSQDIASCGGPSTYFNWATTSAGELGA
jgi:hypothetical protein